MEIIKIAGLAILGALIAMTARQMKGASGAACALAAGVLLTLAALPRISEAAGAILSLSETAGIGGARTEDLIRMTGVAFTTELASDVCRDAGEEGIARKAELCGRAALLCMSLPLAREVLSLSLSFLP